MVEMLFRMECVRQEVRETLLRQFGDLDQRFLGIAGLIFFVALFPMLIAPPAAVAEAPPEAVAVGALVLVGFLLIATVILAPLGFVML